MTAKPRTLLHLHLWVIAILFLIASFGGTPLLAEESHSESNGAYKLAQTSIAVGHPNPDIPPYSRTKILADNPVPLGKGFPSILRPINGDLVYSHFDNNGNTKSIVQYDFTNGGSANLISEKRDPILVAQDARYIVFQTQHPPSFRIEVINRKTGETLASMKFPNPVRSAFIRNDELVLFQGISRDNRFRQALTTIELPSLKILNKTTLPGYYMVGVRGDHIYTAFSGNGKRDLMVFDLRLKELGRFQIPPALEKINLICQPSVEQYDEETAVLIANCGEIHVLNLKSFSIIHSIHRYAFLYSVALYDRLIFTTASERSTGIYNGVIVFDMDTGKEVARLPISASTIEIKGNILLAAGDPVTTAQRASWPMETYRLDPEAIRSARWQMENVLQHCLHAKADLAVTNNLYNAIDECKSAGIEAYAKGDTIPAAVFSALRQYGLWLSLTLDRCDEAVRILEKILAERADPIVKHALNEAKLKSKIVGSDVLVRLPDEEHKMNFARLVENGDKLPNSITKTIDFGAFSNLLYFSGDKLYIGRYGCHTNGCDGGANIGVFDRFTLNQIAWVEVAPDDEDFQDNIVSIVSDNQHIYASVDYRYTQEGRPNFFVIDKGTLKIVKSAQIKYVGALLFDKGKLMVCGSDLSVEQHCEAIDPVTLVLTETPNKMMVDNKSKTGSLVTLSSIGADKTIVAVTHDYFVARDKFNPGTGYFLYHREDGKLLSELKGLNRSLDRPAIVDGNDLLICQSTMGGMGHEFVKQISLPSGKIHTLFGLPTTSSRFAVLALHDQILYVGYGRDLLIFDLAKQHLRHYIKNFILAGFRDNGSGLDANRIDRLIIDRGRLIALTFYGENSRIVPLDDLLK